MKKESIICDICENKVATDICIICKKDVCNNCVKILYSTINFGGPRGAIILKKEWMKKFVCQDCATSTQQYLYDIKISEKLQKELTSEIIKNLMVLKLKEEKSKNRIMN